VSHTPTDPARDEHLLPDRQHRLLACGLCRQVAPYVDRPELLAVLAAAEAFADGRLSAAELALARQFATDIALAYAEMPEQGKFASAVALAAAVAPPSSRTLYKTVEPAAAGLIGRALRGVLDLLADRGDDVPALAGFAELFDDVAPRRAAFAPEWRTDTAVAIARGMYEAREFGAMPILADALQDAGCDDEHVLNHCRDVAQVHVRGCWVVDRVLGLV
jgi:hypothetical protein